MSVPLTVSQWYDLALKWCQVHPVLEPNEILAVVWSESTGNPEAVNPADPSWGLMQITPLIAMAFGGYEENDISWHTDPDKNMGCGAGFLAHLKSKYSAKFPDGEWVTGFNQGEGNLLKGKKDQPYLDAFLSHLEALSVRPV